MRSAGAIVASIGTSIMLVAAFTVSLLSVSAVFAFGGFDGTDDASAGEELVLDLPARSGSVSRPAGAVEAPRIAVVKRHALARRRAAVRHRARRVERVRSNTVTEGTRPAPAGASQVAALGAGTAGQPSTSQQQVSAPPVAKKKAPNLGDGVKQLGNGLSATVQQAGTKLAQVTAPLGQPVSAAVQQVLNLVAALLKRTTDGLGGALGAHP